MILKIRHQTLHLLPEKAVFWEEEKALILADIHIGKATFFQKQGVSIPEGSMGDDLLVITKLIEKLGAEKCLIVGDLIHAKSGLSDAVKKTFSQWLRSCHCEVHLIMGNHDYSLAKNLPKEWSLHLHTKPLLIEPFFFSHFPMHHEHYFVWAGHMHPKIEIKNAHDKVVLRCFQIFSNLGILPAFGSFVGGTYVKKDSDCQIFGIAGSSIIPL